MRTPEENPTRIETAAAGPAAVTGPPVVAVVATSPATVLEDIERAMTLAGVSQHLSPDLKTLLKVNISWQHWYPGCSTTPWQIEGVANGLRRLGHKELIAAHNGTVVVDSFEGEANNKHKAAQDRAGLPAIHLDTPPNRWLEYKPKAEMLVLDEIFPEGIQIPESFEGTNIVHLPTMKTHVFTTMTGAMKNAFGGLLHRKRHWTHSVIHETLVDLLAIQQEIHPGIFAVMDGTFAGDGPGPPGDAVAREGPYTGQRRPSGHRRRGRQDDGVQPIGPQVHPAGPRTGTGAAATFPRSRCWGRISAK